MRRILIFVGFLLISLTSFVPVFAQEKPTRWTPDVMIKYKRVGGVAISADGNLVAYTVSTPIMEGEKSEYLTHIWVASIDGKQNYQFTYGDKSCTDPAFSPDGKYLAFISARGGDDKNQIWLMRVGGGEADQLTRVKSGVNAYRWSPDSKRIAYTMNDPKTDQEEKNEKEKRDMRIIDHNFKYSHLYTISIERESKGERKSQRLTSGNFHVTSFDWSYDGNLIAFAHQINPTADVWITQDISIVPSDSGSVTQLITKKGEDTQPRFSPDGKWLAFISDDEDPKWADYDNLYIMPVQGGQVRKLADTPDRNFGGFHGWSRDSKVLYVTETQKTSIRIFSVPIDGGQPHTVTIGNGNFSSASLSRGSDMMAFIHQTTETAPEVYVANLKKFKPKKLSDVHVEFPKLTMGKTEVIKWKSSDGLEIEGLLTYPVDYEKGKRYPLILNIHGGPAGVFTEGFTAASSVYPFQALAQEGYAVLRPNPRGSSGYGKDFRYANINDWGFGDFNDDMAGVDKVIEMGVAHPESLVVCGWSYGGFMTSFIVTKTKRFKAASVGAGVTDLVSFNGTADIPSFIPDYFGGDSWERTEVYMKHSAVFNVKGVSTPTQVIHGEKDVRVPLSQGQEFYNALKRQGCPTEMIVYPRTPHGVQEPKFILDIGKRIIAWFNKHLRVSVAGTD